MSAWTLFCNHRFTDDAANAFLEEELARRGHTLVWSQSVTNSNLLSAASDPAILQADAALGQPDLSVLFQPSRLKWVHLTTAGYERYDRDDLRTALKSRGVAMTNSSAVYQEPCAEHAMAMILALARRLPHCVDTQRSDRAWLAVDVRAESRVLVGQTVLILSYGSIARRLIELLAPFKMNVIAVRRHPKGNEPLKTISEQQVDEALGAADHVVSILPGGAATKNFMSAQRLGLMKPGSHFYNIGRGTTVDQGALRQSLETGHLGGAYLDVFDPEPLAPDHPLWNTPNCYITPHSAGGQDDEFHILVRHFLANLDRLIEGRELVDRIA